MRNDNLRSTFAIIITLASIPLIIITVLGGMHGGISTLPMIIFILTPWLTWLLIKTIKHSLVYYLSPILLLLTGWISLVVYS